MSNPVVPRSRIQRALASPRLHPSLTSRKKPQAKTAPAPVSAAAAPIGLWPMLTFVFAGLYVAQAGEFTTQAWPLAVLLALHVLALLWGWCTQPRPQPITPNREAKTLIDRRPILLQPVLILPPGRPARILGRVPRTLGSVPRTLGSVPRNLRIMVYPPPHRPAKIRHPRPTLTNGSHPS